jgi:hypothetical protein
VDLLQKNPGVRSEDVFVMVHLTPPANFSFASGVSGTEIVAAQARTLAGMASSFTKPELIDAPETLLLIPH